MIDMLNKQQIEEMVTTLSYEEIIESVKNIKVGHKEIKELLELKGLIEAKNKNAKLIIK